MALPVSIPKKPGWVSEFQAFIMRGNVVDLAVGIVIGAAFTSIVTSLVKDLLTPVLGVAAGGVDFSNLFITLKGTHETTLEAAQKAGAVTMNIGLFLNSVISFPIVSFVIFMIVKALARFQKKAEEAPAGLSTTEQALIEIRDLMKVSRV